MDKWDTPGISQSTGINSGGSITQVPFYEHKKRWRVSSREFLSLNEFLTTKLIKLKTQKLAHFALKTPEGKTVFFKAAWVKPLVYSIQERLNKFRQIVFNKPYYALTQDIERLLTERSKKLEKKQQKQLQAQQEKYKEKKSPTPEPKSYRF